MVENDKLYAALVSWAVARVMDALLPILAVVLKTTWESTMKLVKLVVRLAEILAVNTICSAVIVVGVQLERLVHVARAVGVSFFHDRIQVCTSTGRQPLRPAAPPLFKIMLA